MTRLARQLARQLSGGRAIPADFRAQLAELKARYGTVTATAKALGMDRRTLQRYETGAIRTPRPATLEHIEQATRQARVDQAAVATNQLVVEWKYDSRTRKLTTTNLDLRPGTLESMKRAYVRDDQEGIARAFIDGVGEPWYHQMLDDSYDTDVRGEEASGEGSDAVGAFA